MNQNSFAQTVAQAEHRRRIIAGAAAALMMLSVLLSVTVLIKLGHHDCTGPDCSVCAQIHTAEERLTGGGAGPLHLFLTGLIILTVLLQISLPIQPQRRSTPVTLKVVLLH